MTYPVILADPPWSFRDRGTRLHPSYAGRQRKGAHYKTLSLADLVVCALTLKDGFAPKDGVLFLWAPNAIVLDGHAGRFARSAGYEPKQLIPWVKTDKLGRPRSGGGHYTGVCTEQLLLCTRGRAAHAVKRRMVPGVIHAPRSRHSAKPDASYRLIEQLFDGPYLELFARRCWSPAWRVIGDQLTGETLT